LTPVKKPLFSNGIKTLHHLLCFLFFIVLLKILDMNNFTIIIGRCLSCTSCNANVSTQDKSVFTNITSAAAAVDSASFPIDGATASTSRFIDIFLVIFVFGVTVSLINVNVIHAASWQLPHGGRGVILLLQLVHAAALTTATAVRE
jgi:hypothetical protein